MIFYGAQMSFAVTTQYSKYSMNYDNYEPYNTYQLNDFILDDSFQRWAQGEANPFWDQFSQVYPEKEHLIREAKMMLGALSVEETSLTDTEKANYLSAIYHKIDERENRNKRVIPFIGSTYFRYAASVSVLILLSVLLYYVFLIRPFQYYETAYGENVSVTLADGTEVILNAHSSLKVLRNLEQQAIREVWLEGEAFFKVNAMQVEEGRSSFIVHTPNLDVQVLGTHFNVKSREGNTRVMLEEGSVKVANLASQENMMMTPGEAVELDDKVGKIKKEIAKENKELAWQTNQFVFDNERLSVIANEIFQFYGIAVEFEDPAMGENIFTAEVSRDNLPLLITLLEEAFQMDIQQEGNTLFFQYK